VTIVAGDLVAYLGAYDITVDLVVFAGKFTLQMENGESVLKADATFIDWRFFHPQPLTETRH
jgi:hypothetical protein